MANVEHKNLTGADLHECKGASTAAANTLLQANGAGAATFVDVLGSLKTANKTFLYCTIPDISTAASVFIPAPITGTVSKIFVTLNNAITVADSTVTAEINGVAMTGLSITCAYTGSAAGTTFSGTPSGNNTVVEGGAIEIITDGLSTTACVANVTLVFTT